MEQQKNNSQQPTPCAMGCGFFGNPVTENCCSKCYRDKQKSSGNTNSPSMSANSPILPPQSNSLSTPPLFSNPTVSSPPQIPPQTVQNPEVSEKTEEKPAEISEKVQKDTTRCFNCRKKVGLLGFKCRCNFIFCSGHRHPTDHACDFDYKAMQKSKLEIENAKIVGEKITKI